MYKIWPAICGIADFRLRVTFAMLNLVNDSLSIKIAKLLPEYFCEQKPEGIGPYPLSMIIEEATTYKETCDSIHPYGDHGVPHDVPIFHFVTEEQAVDADDGYLLLPDDLKRQIEAGKPTLSFGHSFTWNGQNIVLMDISKDGMGGIEYDFAPAELIHVDCLVFSDYFDVPDSSEAFEDAETSLPLPSNHIG